MRHALPLPRRPVIFTRRYYGLPHYCIVINTIRHRHHASAYYAYAHINITPCDNIRGRREATPLKVRQALRCRDTAPEMPATPRLARQARYAS